MMEKNEHVFINVSSFAINTILYYVIVHLSLHKS